VTDPKDELLNIYDASGAVVDVRPRSETQAPGFAAGAVQLLVVGPEGKVLLQRRCADKENGGLWDKSVGGHVQAGETFDQALVREANEELFGRAGADCVEIVSSIDQKASRPIAVVQVRLELGLRDIRHAAPPARGLINVRYHAAIYLGRTGLAVTDFKAQTDELDGLDYFEPADIDRMLIAGRLAPNMSFLWFALGGRALALGRGGG
jgi:8-oxo-dGTP pyrophosphatase MutT (NUDIX family)